MSTPPAPASWHTPSQDLWQAGQRQQAIMQQVQHLNQCGPVKPVPVLMQLAYYLYNLQDFRGAMLATGQALAQHPDAVELLSNMATCCSRAGDNAAAAEHAQRAVTLQPDNILSWDVLAVAHWKQGQEQAASEAGSTALRLKDAANAALPAGWSLPAGTPAAMATQAGKQHVIAFSLWGHQPRYLLGMLHNAVLAPVLYPGWVLRCHVDDSVPADFLAALRALEVDVRRQPAGQSLRQKLCWRFLAANDPQVGYFLCRDADSVSGPREVQAVREWLESGRWFHTMRDWWSHSDLMLAGMWGGVAGVLPELQPRLLRYRSGAVETVNIDQWFLRDEVWRYVRTSCLIHDRCFRLHDSRPMPGLLPGQTDHVGIDASVALHQQQLRLLAPWIRELASLASLRPALQQLLQPSASPEPARP